MIDEKFLNVLKKIALKLIGIRWVLGGSANFALQGMDFKPRYLDIIIAYKDLEKVKDLFSEYSFSEVKEIKNREGVEFRFDVDGAEVQICADYEHGIYYKQMKDENIIKIKINNMEIPVLKIESELRCYEHIGNKEEKIKKIKEFIANR